MKSASVLVLAAGMACGQTFEVASVKPHPIPPGQFLIRIPNGPGIEVRGDHFKVIATLNELIMDAYGVEDYRIVGSPAWAVPTEGDHFDVDAKSEGVPSAGELRQMLQALLAERFQLKLHRETRELPVYALTVAKGGAKLRKLGDDEKPPTSATRPRERPATLMSSIPALIWSISRAVDRPVVDQTGLPGIYEYANLNWAQFARDRRAASADTPVAESVFTALQQELGLKLEPRKDPVKVLVIEHAERPSAN